MKIFILFFTMVLTISSTNSVQIKPLKTLTTIYQPSVVDILDPSRPRLT
jgi:hypothetical protein